MRITPRSRRGSLLLVVLSLLILFTMVGITFVLLAGQYKKAAQTAARHEMVGDSPKKELERAMYQLLRGTENDRSAILGHSLLNDLYGANPIRLSGEGATKEEVLHVIPLPDRGPIRLLFSHFAPNPEAERRRLAGFGQTLTMIDGPAKGLSTRILRYFAGSQPGAQHGTYHVDFFDTDVDLDVTELVGNQFIVNDRPFNGAGSGVMNLGGQFWAYPEREKANLTDPLPFPNRPRTLLPHYAGSQFTLHSLVTGEIFRPMNPLVALTQANTWGANESYDAADYQNMFLARVPPDVLSSALARQQIIPSFHRPALVHYWNAQHPEWFANIMGNSEASVAARHLVRPIIFRPMPWDHPNFTGSNPAFTTDPSKPQESATALLDALRGRAPDGSVHSPWDVDNDGDSIADSVWIDLGLPHQTALDGRTYKRLFAILCVDLDGRLNVNTHGSLEQLAQPQTANLPNDEFAGGQDPRQVFLPRGLGFGPADVDLSSFFGLDDARALMVGRNDLATSGRYGVDGVPGMPLKDPLNMLKISDLPHHHGTPQDISGTRWVGLDVTGTPIIRDNSSDTDTQRWIDDPYEMRLDVSGDSPTSIDQPFTWNELEQLLRYSDADVAQLRGRLLKLASRTLEDSTLGSKRHNRSAITTESRDIPVVNDTISIGQRIGNAIIRDALRPGSGYSEDENDRLAEMGTVFVKNLERYVPLKVLQGQKMDLNRVWGNGRQDGTDGTDGVGQPIEVIDNPQEADDGEHIWGPEAPEPFYDPNTSIFDYIGSLSGSREDEPIQLRRHARQIYARNLYCLVMAMLANGELEQGGEFLFPVTEDLTDPQKYELTARRIAQWAINVVDFRDPDAIMSPFEYDVRPFNRTGWDSDIDGNPKTDEYQKWVADGKNENPDGGGGRSQDRRLVWGCEYPDLLLTETLAFHDRRVRDTAYIGATDQKKRKKEKPEDEQDLTLDQVQVPQGSLFLEFYCTRGRQTSTEVKGPSYPQELYSLDNNHWKLDLGRMAGNTPVWRVVIGESQRKFNDGNVEVAGKKISPAQQRKTQQASISYDPFNRSLLHDISNDVPEPLAIDRIIWFTGQAPLVNHPHRDRIYFGRGRADTLLTPSSYAVVGPRRITHLGSEKDEPSTLEEDESLVPSRQRIEINSNPNATITVDEIYGNNGSYPASEPLQVPPLGIIAESFLTTNSQEQGPVAGVSITEPLPGENYYPVAEFYSRPGPLELPDLYVDIPGSITAPEISANVTAAQLDEPFDSQEDQGKPLADDDMVATGVYEDYKTAFLQRLANPLLRWNPPPLSRLGLQNSEYVSSRPVNPYITVDWMPIDVTVFNGSDYSGTEGDNPQRWTEEDGNFDEDDVGGVSHTDMMFQTRERGGDQLTASDRFNVWAQSSVAPHVKSGGDPTNHFPERLTHTLGYLNKTYADTELLQGVGRKYNKYHYRGAPPKPFPWLTWNNRPFTNPFELMLVPSSDPSRLVGEITTAQNKGFEDVDPYRPELNSSNAAAEDKMRQFQAPFRHLLNFLQTTRTEQTGDGPETALAGNLYRLFEYVEVPSRFVGREKWYNPTVTSLTGFGPPYNQFSRLRDPGKVNINTIADMRVWKAITRLPSAEELLQWFPNNTSDDNQGLNVKDSWLRLTRSRRGYIATNDPLYDPKFPHLHSAFPSQFNDPFRSYASPSGTHTLPNGTKTGTPYVSSLVTSSALPQAGVEATLLRSDALALDPSDRRRPLLGYRGRAAHTDTSRHAHFRYDGIGRLANLVTNHSNVFAVWITVGYFEVEPVDRDFLPAEEIDKVYPDGLWLGQELGSDQGDSKRHRAFYIIDRSIPVAFERGKNHNVDRSVILRRFIE